MLAWGVWVLYDPGSGGRIVRLPRASGRRTIVSTRAALADAIASLAVPRAAAR